MKLSEKLAPYNIEQHKNKMKKYLIEQDDDQEIIDARNYLEACKRALNFFGITVIDITEVEEVKSS